MMKITDALCDWIEDAGGTATEAEQESIVNAMHTLYTAMGGEEPEVMPDDIATWVQYLSTVAGGGGSVVAEGTVTSANDATMLSIDIGMDSFKLLVINAGADPTGRGHASPVTVTLFPHGGYFTESRLNTNSSGTMISGGMAYADTDTHQYTQDGTVVTVKSVIGHWANIDYKWIAVA